MIREFVENNPKLVQIKKSTRYPDFSVLKYSKKVFYDDLWTPELEMLRGLVIDKDWHVVSRPFNKIYNYSIEPRAPVFNDAETVFAMRKVNGFMAAITYDTEVGLVISTTGSLDSHFVGMIEQTLALYNRKNYMQAFKANAGYTHLFECVHNDDPHIVPEVPGLYYLGSTLKDTKLSQVVYLISEIQYHFNSAENLHIRMVDLKQLVKTVKHEGFVIYNEQGLVSKIKSPWYLVNKLYARKESVDHLVHNKAKQMLDEEYYPLIGYIKENSRDFNAMDEQERLKFIRAFYGG